ncbi:MAG TPA: heterodisulfide reductase-related iron-sulfur binding cluster [Nitrososphaerales archaeon]|nr:heterodisulfide reductase-related iron-sulfur binding cluster [Nitrososphaerales archaeon]
MVVPVREIFITHLVPYSYDVMYAAFFAAGLVMLYGLYTHLQSYGIGLSQFLSLCFKDFRTKLRRFLAFGVGQRRVLGDPEGGLMHGALFFGFLMLFAYTSLIFLQNDILPLFTTYVFIAGNFYLLLEFLGDTLGLAFVVGLMIAIYRRFVQKLDKLETGLDDYFVLGMLVWIGVSGFMLESLRLIAFPVGWAGYSWVGDSLSMLLSLFGPLKSDAVGVYEVFWFAHMLSVMALIAATPYTKLLHVFTSGANVALAPVKPMGKLSTPFSLPALLAAGSAEFPQPAKTVAALAPLQLLALDACTDCGRCQEVCPAYASGRDLSPRVVVQDLAKDMKLSRDADVFSTGVIRDSELWSCTMCNACVSVCPVFIDQVDYISEYRRTLVSEGKLDGRKRIFLENVAQNSNPFGLPQRDRQTWLVEMGVPTLKEKPDAEYLYWVGCQSSYDPRGRNVAKSMVKILRLAGVDFAVLGDEESCTGEPVRRMGEEGRFQEMAMKNVETLKRYGVKKVIVHCAHCFNTFLNEYPEFGADFQVIHHTQLIASLMSQGKLPKVKVEGTMTYHDPCNLGRINGVFEEPRSVLASLSPQVVEMERNRAKSFCCGGGGANVWYEVSEKKKISVLRAEEARATGAGTLAVACPFCITMFEDAVKNLEGDPMRVADIAELVAMSLGDPN